MSSPQQPVIKLDERRSNGASNPERATYVARACLCMLEGRVKDNRKESFQKVIASLKDDPRVKDLVAVDFENVSLRIPTFAAAAIDKKTDFPTGVPISASAHIHALEISPPIQFTVQIPRRLQVPKGASEKSVPSDEYWVVWDGILLVVLWRNEGERPYGILGGSAVVKLLKEIAKKSGKDTYVQACSPNCSYQFAHRDIQVISNAEPTSVSHTFIETAEWSASLELDQNPAPGVAAFEVFKEIRPISRTFAQLRSNGKTISDIEKAARDDLRELLKLYHSTTITGSSCNPKSWKAKWEARGWRRNARRLIARLWLALSALESRRHDWINTRHAYDRMAARQGLDLIFRLEYEEEVNYISAVEVSSIESAVEYAAGRLDTQSVVVATAAGAISGAIIGAIVAGLIHFAGSPATSSPSNTPSISAHVPSPSPTGLHHS